MKRKMGRVLKVKKIIVIGGGPSGMMAAGMAASRGCHTILFEKNNRMGKKLSITGKGRCNVTNATDPEGMLANTPGHPEFLYSAFYTFGSEQLMSFFESLGVPLKIERGSRVFPVSDKAADIVEAMKRFMLQNHVRIKLNAEVSAIWIEENKIRGVIFKDGGREESDAVVIATGGLSYPATGSTGDGYRFAKSLGHIVTELRPSLVPLFTEEKWPADLQGLSLKNVGVTLRNNKVLYQERGELLFTHYGVSGPTVLSASRFIKHSRPTLSIDLKPALTEKALDLRLLRDFAQNKNKHFANSLSDLLPQKIIPVIISLCDIPPDRKINTITKEERNRLVRRLKQLDLTITGDAGFQEAVVTQGGVTVTEIDPSSMRSKRFKNLFFAGEVLDVDALTGGYNLQIAFATGYLAGAHSAVL
jgi:predicted Rossmann fold flavoprotein